MGPWLSSFDEPQDVIESIGRARAAGHRQKGHRQCCVFLSCPHCFLTRCTEMDGKPRPFKQCLTRDLCLFFFFLLSGTPSVFLPLLGERGGTRLGKGFSGVSSLHCSCTCSLFLLGGFRCIARVCYSRWS